MTVRTFLTSRARTALSKPFMPVVFFFAGVTYDGLTLTRIDRLLDNLIVLLYLVVLGVLIILTARAELRASPVGVPRPDVSPSARLAFQWVERARPYFPHAMQFLFGGLFSAYTIFYSRSASLTGTAVFFFLLVALLVANEFLRDRLSSLRLMVSLYALVSFSFITFFLPVLTGWMNTAVFLIGAVISLGVVWRVVGLVYQGMEPVSVGRRLRDAGPGMVLVALLVGFYFLGWIPPVPLSMEQAGVYHAIAKSEDQYRLSFERGAWYELWKRSDNPFRGDGPVYCFTAVFAPVSLKTTVIHHWQYRRADSSRPFMTTDRIPIEISGGREGGYRGYTVKQRAEPGEWRVDVETQDGRIIGRVRFEVVARESSEPVVLDTVVY